MPVSPGQVFQQLQLLTPYLFILAYLLFRITLAPVTHASKIDIWSTTRKVC